MSKSEPPELDTKEITGAVDRSGYPFELEVLNRLASQGISATPGFRLRVMEGTARASRGDAPEPGSAVTRDIDVMAQVQAGAPIHMAPGIGAGLTLHVLLLIEAKVLPTSTAFVGFSTPHVTEALVSRSSAISGVPEGGHVWNLLSSGFAPLGGVPVCVQWATIEWDASHKRYKADHDHAWAAAISHLVRAQSIWARDTTRHLLINDGQNARVNFVQPTIVAKTAKLFVFDTATGTLTETQRLALTQYVELHDGKIAAVIVDVLTSHDLDGMARRLKEVQTKLRDLADRVGTDLVGLAMKERSDFVSETGALFREKLMTELRNRGD